MLVLGALVVLIGLLGCATCKCKKPCFTIPFIVFTFIIGLVLLIIGVIVIGFVGDFVDEGQAFVCD